MSDYVIKSVPLKISWWFLKIFWYAGWVLAALVLLGILVGNYGDYTMPYIILPIEVIYENLSGELPFDQVAGEGYAPVIGFEHVRLDVTDYPLAINMLWIPLILLVGFQWLVQLLLKFLTKVREGKPFDPLNPKVLQKIGILVTIAEPVYGILNEIYAYTGKHLVDLPGASVYIKHDINPFIIFLGLVILVIAKIYDIAVKMKIEADLTI